VVSGLPPPLPVLEEKKMQTGACTSICIRSSYLSVRGLPRPTGTATRLPGPRHPLKLLRVHLSATPRVGPLPPDTLSISCPTAVGKTEFCSFPLPVSTAGAGGYKENCNRQAYTTR
jgi:hypothetical protein